MDHLVNGFTKEKTIDVIALRIFKGTEWLMWLDQRLTRIGFVRLRDETFRGIDVRIYGR